jgi:hypothetical protein
MSEPKTAAPVAAAPAKPNRKLMETQLVSAEYQRQEMVATPEPGTTLEEMLNPEYWSHIAKRVKVWDRIEVRSHDGAWWAELLVRAVQPFAVRVHVLRVAKFDDNLKAAEQADLPAGYEVVNRGARGWTVIRESDREVLREREASRALAVMWLKGHLQVLGQAAAA